MLVPIADNDRFLKTEIAVNVHSCWSTGSTFSKGEKWNLSASILGLTYDINKKPTITKFLWRIK